ncbi:hypothetical protein niasHS_002924 [Heterodera schachtii]|uniref:Uncharacterized protein n=1 Tax=Heterodera schachtii TaxID=97005 RepID=A0ABD2K9M3_HETSC
MEVFFLRHSEYERLFNCTGLDIDSIPLERRQNVPESIAVCVLCTIYYILYIPCMYSIWKHMRDNSCYKLLFYIGCVDLGILWIIGFFAAWLNFRGAVFCSNPTLIYFAGIGVASQWNAETTADLVLAFNRCLDLSSPYLSNLFFSGRRTSFWIIGCTLYALYWALFCKPAVYSSLYFGWFFYPFVGYRNTNLEEYENLLHVVHNCLVSILCPLVYLIFVGKLFYNVRKTRQQFGTVLSDMSTVQIRTFAQVFLLSMMNTITSSIYVYMQFNETHQWMITLAQFTWIHVHGFPAVIYLALNKTIRSDCWMLYMKVFHRNRISYVSGITMLRPIGTIVSGAPPPPPPPATAASGGSGNRVSPSVF